MSTLKLFCFPYAGGSSVIFNKWKSHGNLAPSIEIVPVELAGRGRRMQDTLYADLDDAVQDLYEKISPVIGESPYAILGHSLGGLLAYELAQKIKLLDVPQPQHLFFSGKSAPDIEKEREKKYHLMSNDEFRQEVIQLGGTPLEFFNHPELMDLYLPLLRNDFRLAETNLTNRVVSPFDCDISVFLGKEDHEITAAQANGWKTHTHGLCHLHYFNGGHFFLRDETDDIVDLISHTLTRRSESARSQKVRMSF